MNPTVTPPTFSNLLDRVFGANGYTGILGFFFGLASLGLVAMIVYGGFLRLTAGNNPGGIKASSGTITMAIVGFAVVMISILIVQTVAKLLGWTGNVTDINIPTP